MKNYIKMLFFGIIIAAGMVSCSDDPEKVEKGVPGNVVLESGTVNRREAVVIYGNNLGTLADGGKLYLDSIQLPSDSIRFWNNTRIEFMPLQSAGKHTVYALIDTVKTPVLTFNLNDIRNFDMIEIPGGSFSMGSASGLPNEKPQHEVTLTRSFFMSKYEISQAVYIDVLGENPSLTINEKMPVNNISYANAVKFCNEISKRSGLTPCYKIGSSIAFDTTANGYRLPTEAEWEYAAKSGRNDEFSGGDWAKVCWCSSNSGMQLHDSGKLAGNSLNLFDMSGNLWEWCSDYYSEDFYSTSAKINPVNLNGAGDTLHVLRGGAYNSGITYCRVSARTQPEEKIKYTGIRLVKNK